MRSLPVCQRVSGAISRTYAHPAGRKITALQCRFHALPVSRENAEYAAEKEGNIRSVHVLVYQVKTVGDLLFHRDATLLIGLQLESCEAGDKQNNFIQKLHQSFSMPFFGLVSP